jgi:hypothetical protein
MKATSASVLILLASLLALPATAQLAYTRVVMPEDILLSANIDAEPEAGSAKMVHGIVQGMRGVLPGATVWLHGSKTVAVANAEGIFELTVPADATDVQVTCSYAGLQEEVITLPVDATTNNVYLLRTKAPAGAHFVSDFTMKDRCELLVKKVRNATR